VIDEANEALRAKGYSEAQLAAFTAPLPGRALLKGNRIVSPFSDSEEVVARVARDAVPPFAELATRRLTPHELREWLAEND
jgi:hypothetical protein